MKTMIKKIKKKYRNGLILAGIFDGVRAFTGPKSVQIDLTDSCNNNCIACWCRSPLLGEKKQGGDETLEYSTVLHLIDQLHKMGTQEIILSGGGEPFKHPYIIDIIDYIKKKNIICGLNTNFTLVDEDMIKKMCYLELDDLTVSLWAATPETYAITHPNKTKETFIQIKERLKMLVQARKNGKPRISLYNVISNLNYQEIPKMVDLVKEIGADYVGFNFVDTIPGKTECLLLNDKQLNSLIESCEKIKEKFSNATYEGFMFGQFLRRTKSAFHKDAEYDKEFIHTILPCYIGWRHTRILANGNVISCCKSHRFPIGNIYSQSFHQLWNCKRQKIFRKRTKVYKKDDPIFRLIGNDPNSKVGCYKACDDLARMVEIHQKIAALTLLEKVGLYILWVFNVVFDFFNKMLKINKKIVVSRRRVLKFTLILFLLSFKLIIDIYIYVTNKFLFRLKRVFIG